MYEEFKGIQIERPKAHIKKDAWTITMPLAELYREGWWITEIFGSYANVVKKSQSPSIKRYYYFCNVSLFIDPKTITPKAQKLIDKIKKEKWKKYGPMLTRTKK